MNAIETLISVLCGPEGKCCISGSDDDRRLIDSALAELAQATAAPAGDWLWIKLMDFCKKRGFAPANFNDLFEIVDAARAARAPADSVQEDAARYRWLRAQHWNESELAVVTNPKSDVRIGAFCPSGELLDWFIDAARKQGEKQ